MRTKIPIHRVNRYIPQCDVCDSISSQSTTTPETTPPYKSCIVWIFSGKYNYTTQWKHIFNTSPSISMTQYHPTFVTVKKHLTTLRTTSYSTHQVFPNPQPLNNIIIHSFALRYNQQSRTNEHLLNICPHINSMPPPPTHPIQRYPSSSFISNTFAT